MLSCRVIIMSVELERGKSYLQSSASAAPSPLGLLGSSQNKGQRTLYDHLTDLVLLLIKDKPKPEEVSNENSLIYIQRKDELLHLSSSFLFAILLESCNSPLCVSPFHFSFSSLYEQPSFVAWLQQ